MDTNDVTPLLDRGYTFIPVPESLVQPAKIEYRQLIDRFQELPAAERAFARPGEAEAELGLIRRDGQAGKDRKWFVHYAVDWDALVTGPMTDHPTLALAALYQHVNELGASICSALLAARPELFAADVATSLQQAGSRAVSGGTNTLRGLYYPAATADAKPQTGAKGHFDRSFLTVHLGDEGGDLYAHESAETTEGVRVSPVAGQALVFFGVKAAIASNGQIEPLFHSSRTNPGEDRTALVQFLHADVGVVVDDAAAAYAQLPRT